MFIVRDSATGLYLNETSTSAHESGNWTDDRAEAAVFDNRAVALANARTIAGPQRSPVAIPFNAEVTLTARQRHAAATVAPMKTYGSRRKS